MTVMAEDLTRTRANAEGLWSFWKTGGCVMFGTGEHVFTHWEMFAELDL